MKNFDTFGVMIDCSRNAVMSVKSLKNFLGILNKMGYNQVQLYMEDTYELENEPLFGHFRGRYSADELRELDDFAFSLGIELVPCIQTLAHLNAPIYLWRRFNKLSDINDILLVGEKETYELVENMIKSLKKCFRTDKIHIGMDEAWNLGRGKYLDKHGLQNRHDILLEHLNEVCKITDKYGFKPMMWSDMFYRIANGGEYYATNTKFNDEIKKEIPENLTLVYWDYYHTDKKTYASMIKGHKKLTENVAFAGGAWRWVGFTPHNHYSIRTTKAALTACIEGGLRNAFITMWGDNGAECSSYSVLPSLCYAACLAEGITAISDIKAKFKEWVGADFDDFMLLDLPDRVHKADGEINPSKYELYNDCFMGMLDSAIVEGDSKAYATAARRLKNAAKRNGEYGYLFDTAAKLSNLLAIKAELSLRTKKVCEGKNSDELDALIKDYKKAIKRAEEFYYAFRKQWFLENKPHGFDVQDIRLGGLIRRMTSCMERLIELRDGKIDFIEELLEESNKEFTPKCMYNGWSQNVTANII